MDYSDDYRGYELREGSTWEPIKAEEEVRKLFRFKNLSYTLSNRVDERLYQEQGLYYHASDEQIYREAMCKYWEECYSQAWDAFMQKAEEEQYILRHVVRDRDGRVTKNDFIPVWL